MVVRSRTLRSASRTFSQTLARVPVEGFPWEFSLGRIGTVNGDEDVGKRDVRRRPRQTISARGPPGAGDQPRSLQLEQDLDQVTLWVFREIGKSREFAGEGPPDLAWPAPGGPGTHIPPLRRSSWAHRPQDPGPTNGLEAENGEAVVRFPPLEKGE